jgi:hypothetical protein
VTADALSCVLREAQVLVRFSELCFEVCPHLHCCGAAPPFATTLCKEASVEDKLVGVGDDLLGSSVGAAARVCKIHRVFDLWEEVFDGLGWVICRAAFLVGGGNVQWRDVAIGLEQIFEKLWGCDVGKSSMPVLQGTEIHFCDGID